MRGRSAFTLVLFCAGALSANAAILPASLTVTVVPNAPTNLGVSATSPTQIVLNWTNTSDAPVSIERKTGTSGTYAEIATTTSNIATYIDNGLSAATTYYYRLRAFIDINYSDYGNETSTTTQSSGGSGGSGGGGGGGGGGGYVAPAFITSAVFKGIAYPSSNVTLLQNGQVVAVTQAGPDARFEIDLSNSPAGTYNFGLWASDPEGNRSLLQTFQITVANGATTVISGIFFAPTIGSDKIAVKQGDVITFLGYTAPQATVTVILHSSKPVVKNVTSSNEGAWIYQINSDLLDLGDHQVSARAAQGASVTTDSQFLHFIVGTQNISAPILKEHPTIGDLNGDDRIDLVDFSIMAYWYRRPNPPADVDLNGDGVINLTDFSILAYYWTG